MILLRLTVAVGKKTFFHYKMQFWNATRNTVVQSLAALQVVTVI